MKKELDERTVLLPEEEAERRMGKTWKREVARLNKNDFNVIEDHDWAYDGEDDTWCGKIVTVKEIMLAMRDMTERQRNILTYNLCRMEYDLGIEELESRIGQHRPG